MEKRIYQQTEKGIAFSCRYYIVWCTVFRRPILTEPMQIRLKGVIRQGCQELEVRLLDMQIRKERIILQVETTPVHAINRVIYGLRTRCASTLRKEFPELLSRVPSVFTYNYFVTTEETLPEEQLEEWVEAQPRSEEMKLKRRKEKYGNGA